MNKKELEFILQEGEGLKIEFKENFSDEVIESLVAFANNKGGRVIIGIDKKKNLKGVSISEESLQNWINEIKTKTFHTLLPISRVEKINGKNFVESVTLSKPFKGSKELKVEGVFIEVGHIVENELAKSIGVKVDGKGEIITDKDSKTNVPGFYAAGDVTNREFKQAITGVAEACVAADQAYKHIAEINAKKNSK
jgi:thioredoxin reductase